MHSPQTEDQSANDEDFDMKSSRYPFPECGIAPILMKGASILLLIGFFATRTLADGSGTGQPDGQILTQLSLQELGDVEVTTVSKEPEEVWNTPAAVYVLTQEDIRRSGATSIPEALRLVPGVEVARVDANHWAVGIRGFGSGFSKSVLVLIDGRSVYTPLYAGVYWDVQNVPMEDIDHIEVIRGPGGTIWGANAVNGVINIITKSASETHGGLAAVGGGNVDEGRGDFQYGGGNGNGFDYRVYGMAFRDGEEFHPNHDEFDAWELGQAGFRTDWKRQDRDTFTLQGDLYNGSEGQLVSVSSYSPPSTLNLPGPVLVSGGNLLGRWERKFKAGSDLQIQTYYDRTSRLTPQLGEIRDTFDVDVLYHLTLKWKQDVLLGAGARWSPDDIIQRIPTLDFLPAHETDRIFSWFLQDQIPIVPKRVSLILGSKFENNNYTGFEIQPTARLLWTPTKRQTVWAAITRAVRTPSRLDEDLDLTDLLSAGTVPIYLRVLGNGQFVSEVMIGSEVGYRTLIAKALYLDIAAFHNDYSDLYGYGAGTGFVEALPAPVHLVLQLPPANTLRGDTNGFEIAPDWKPLGWWQLKGSYSYLQLAVHNQAGLPDPLGVVASDNGSSPHHGIVLQSLFNLPKRFELDATYRFESALPAQLVPSYNTADLRLGWHPSKQIELSLVGQNLVQPRHVEFGGDPGPLVGIKRDVYAKITWTQAR